VGVGVGWVWVVCGCAVFVGFGWGGVRGLVFGGCEGVLLDRCWLGLWFVSRCVMLVGSFGLSVVFGREGRWRCSGSAGG